MKVDDIAVVGAGLMGHGIAQAGCYKPPLGYQKQRFVQPPHEG